LSMGSSTRVSRSQHVKSYSIKRPARSLR
jgi:hypothetical protein